MWHNGKPKELGPLRAKPNFQTLLYFEAEILKFGSSVAAGTLLSPRSRAGLFSSHGVRSIRAAAEIPSLWLWRKTVWGWEQATACHGMATGSHGLMILMVMVLIFASPLTMNRNGVRRAAKGFLRHQLNNPCDDQFEAMSEHRRLLSSQGVRQIL